MKQLATAAVNSASGDQSVPGPANCGAGAVESAGNPGDVTGTRPEGPALAAAR